MTNTVVYAGNTWSPPELAPKDPDGVIVYTWDWTDWLDGETISTSVFTVESGITNDDDSIVSGSLKTSIQLSGGTAGEKYLITNKITTATRTSVRSAYVRVVNR